MNAAYSDIKKYPITDQVPHASYLQSCSPITSLNIAMKEIRLADSCTIAHDAPETRPSTDGTHCVPSGRGMLCPVPGCGKLLPNRFRRSEHMSWHRGETICPVCGFCFTTRNSLRVHMTSGAACRRHPAQMPGPAPATSPKPEIP